MEHLPAQLRAGQRLGLHPQLPFPLGQRLFHLGQQGVGVQLLPVGAGGDGDRFLPHLIGEVNRGHIQLIGHRLDHPPGLLLPLRGEGGGGYGQGVRLVGQPQPQRAQLPEGRIFLGGKAHVHRGLGGAVHQLTGELQPPPLAVQQGELAGIQPLVHLLADYGQRVLPGEFAQLGHRLAPVIHRHRPGQQLAVIPNPGAQAKPPAGRHGQQGNRRDAGDQRHGNAFFRCGFFHTLQTSYLQT